MIKLIKTIVDSHRRMIGFVVEGKGTEFKEVSNEKVQRPMLLDALTGMNFVNNQIAITPKGVQERGNFKVNELPMTVYVNGQFIDVDNKIALSKRYLQNNEPIGFEVVFSDGTKDNFTYPNVIKLSFWFKPDNFVVRTSANHKKFISGKPGAIKLEDLPTQVIGEKKENKPKRVKSAAQEESKVEATGMFNNALDIFDLYGAIHQCDGLIIKLPGEAYQNTGKAQVETANEFKALGVGEYAFPKLSFNETKLNANTMFKKPGMVSVEFGAGATMPIQSYVSKAKSIFFNAENHIEKIGVALPKSAEASFIKAFGKTMSVQPIKHDQLIQSITSLSGKSDLVFYEVNTNKIGLLSDEKIAQYTLPTEKLMSLVDELFINKSIVKYLAPGTGLIGELKKTVKIPHQEVAGKQPIGLYAGMNADFRQKITEAGIDIYTGAFIKTTRPEKSDVAEAEAEKKKEDTSVVIEYCIKGKEHKVWTYKKIAEAGKAGVGLPQEIISMVKYMESIADPVKKMQEAYRLHKEYEAKRDEIIEIIWKHKCAMYLASHKLGIHQHDKAAWKIDTGRKTKATVYNCVKPGCEGLMIAVLNTEI